MKGGECSEFNFTENFSGDSKMPKLSHCEYVNFCFFNTVKSVIGKFFKVSY